MGFLLGALAALTIFPAAATLSTTSYQSQNSNNITVTNTSQNTSKYPIFTDKAVSDELTKTLLTTYNKKFSHVNSNDLKIIRILTIPDHPYLYVVLTSTWKTTYSSQNATSETVVNQEHELDMWGWDPSNVSSPFTFLNQVSKGMSTQNSYFYAINYSNLQILKAQKLNNNDTFTLSFNYAPINKNKILKSTKFNIPIFFSINPNNKFLEVNPYQLPELSSNDATCSGDTWDNVDINNLGCLTANWEKYKDILKTSFILPDPTGNNQISNVNSETLYLWVSRGKERSIGRTGGGQFSTIVNGSITNIEYDARRYGYSAGTQGYDAKTSLKHPNWLPVLDTDYSSPSSSVLSQTSLPNKNKYTIIENGFYQYFQIVSLDTTNTSSNEHGRNTTTSHPLLQQKLFRTRSSKNSVVYITNEKDNELHYITNVTQPDSELDYSSISLKQYFPNLNDNSSMFAWDDNVLNALDISDFQATALFSGAFESDQKLDISNKNQTTDNKTYLISVSPKKITRLIDLTNTGIDTNNVLAFYKQHTNKAQKNTTSATNYFLTRSITENNVTTYEADQLNVLSDSTTPSYKLIKLATSSSPLLGTTIELKDPKNPDRAYEMYLNYNFLPSTGTTIDEKKSTQSINPALSAYVNLALVNPIAILNTNLNSALNTQMPKLSDNLTINFDLNDGETDITKLNEFKTAISTMDFNSAVTNLINKIVTSSKQLALKIKSDESKNIFEGYNKFFDDQAITNKVYQSSNIKNLFINQTTNFQINITSANDLLNNFANISADQIIDTTDPLQWDQIDHYIMNIINNDFLQLPNKIWNNKPDYSKGLPTLVSSYNSYNDELTRNSAKFNVKFSPTTRYTFDQLVNAANISNFIAYSADHLKNVDTKNTSLLQIFSNVSKYDPNLKTTLNPIIKSNNSAVLNENAIKLAVNKFNITSAKQFVTDTTNYFNNLPPSPSKHSLNKQLLLIEIVVPIAGVLLISGFAVFILILVKYRKNKPNRTGFAGRNRNLVGATGVIGKFNKNKRQSHQSRNLSKR